MGQLELFGAEGRRPTLREIWAADEPERPVAVPNATVAAEDVPRLTAALQRLYDVMKDGQWHTATELQAIAGRRYGARLHEFACAGIPYESQRITGGEWRYRLLFLVHGPTGPA